MIEQQYYTRERGGLFGRSDGYDSIAKSEGLKLEFIKKYLHPLCSYDIPNELQKSNEANEEKYPANFIITQAPTGEMIIGQAVYKSKDFTGLRSTFFMHNYVVPSQEKLNFLKNPKQLLGISSFVSAYDINIGKELPTLRELSYDSQDVLFNDKEKLFKILGLTEKLFKQLIYAIYTSVVSKKKVYICLDVQLEDLTYYAKALLCHIYQNLPRVITKDLGVNTYCKAPEAKKGIHIMFVEKGSIRYGDPKVDKEFVFDFTTQRFLNVETAELNKCCDFAFRYSGNSLMWEAFNEFIENIAKGMDVNLGKSIEVHNQLAILFEMQLYMRANKDYVLGHSSYRNNLLSHIAKYIELPVDKKTKLELITIMVYAIKLLVKEIDKDVLLELGEIKEIVKFKLSTDEDREGLVLLLMHNLGCAAKLKKEDYIKSILDALYIKRDLYVQLFKSIYNKEDLRHKVGYIIIDDYFKGANRLDEFISAMEKFELLEEIFKEDLYYKKLVSSLFNKCMANAFDKVKLLKTVQAWCKTKKHKIYNELFISCEKHVLENIELKSITLEKSLLDLQFSTSYICLNYKVIEIYKEMKNNKPYLQNVDEVVLKQVQELIKQYYSQSIKTDDFYMLVYAFVQVKGDGYGGYDLEMNMRAILTFLARINRDIVLDFIIWAKSQTQYINPTSFDPEVIHYFLKMKKSREKVPKEAIKSKLGQNVKTKRLYQKIKESQQSKITKFFINHRKGSLYCSLLIVLCGVAGGVYYGYQMQRTGNEKPGISISTTSSSLSAETTSSNDLNINLTSGAGLSLDTTSGADLSSDTTSGAGLSSDTTSGADLNADTTSGADLNTVATSGAGLNADTTSGTGINAGNTSR